MTNLIPLPGGRTNDDGHGDGGGAVSLFAAERAAFAAARAARERQDTAEAVEVARADAEYRARVAAAVGIAAAAAGRAAAWVEELAARTGGRRLAGYAAAVLACGRDLDPENDPDGQLPELAHHLDRAVNAGRRAAA
ncbi:hypothetical protein ACFWP2_39310 [Kitasatospora sp. NPDC058444]|uniref:hypothetical protein n=1 Tax=Kitasatospora sp. NPDC058444 TaxID=3346504 RepID=UPI003650D084